MRTCTNVQMQRAVYHANTLKEALRAGTWCEHFCEALVLVPRQ